MSDIQADPHDGEGGSYLLDPQTNQRTLIERTQPAPAPDADEEASEPVVDEESTDPA